MRYGEEEWSFFLNAYYPLAAIRRESPKSDFGYLGVDELSQLSPESATPDYTLLTREQLEERLTPQVMARLDAAEVKQARYWQPQTVEDLIFNNWD
ncbi:hypothetical protein PA598K_05436 [Paenibacillus sp. 598K]|uniref:hypothetical protein n=1 Tax=Paenibacillus sp. 598K TaxID=1117987 RepID=UPI000FF94CFC|nr:hypothetical protein [Paenibacillus sp. 598K]GBF76922.1 hypothetical protein PA598K_05436 [Paenibacillus sp. 598K]